MPDMNLENFKQYLDSIKETHLGLILSPDAATSRSYGVRGRAHGKEKRNTGNGRLPIYDELVTDGQRGIKAFQLDLKDLEDETRKKIEGRNKDLEETLIKRAEDLGKEKSAALNDFEKSAGRQSDEFLNIARGLTQAEQDYKRFRDELGREARHSPRWLYVVYMSIIAVLEWPINRYAFAAVFQDSLVVASILALFIGALLIGFAHSTGLNLRRLQYKRDEHDKKTWNIIWILVSLVIVALLIFVISIARHAYIDIVSQGNLSAIDLFKGITERLSASRFGTQDFLLVVVNIAIFSSGVGFSIGNHDPHEEYEKTARKKHSLEKKQARFESGYRKNRREVESKFAERQRILAQRIDETRLELDDLNQRLALIVRMSQDTPKEVSAEIAKRLALYQQEYLGAYGKENVPKELLNSYSAKDILKLLPNEGVAN